MLRGVSLRWRAASACRSRAPTAPVRRRCCARSAVWSRSRRAGCSGAVRSWRGLGGLSRRIGYLGHDNGLKADLTGAGESALRHALRRVPAGRRCAPRSSARASPTCASHAAAPTVGWTASARGAGAIAADPGACGYSMSRARISISAARRCSRNCSAAHLAPAAWRVVATHQSLGLTGPQLCRWRYNECAAGADSSAALPEDAIRDG